MHLEMLQLLCVQHKCHILFALMGFNYFNLFCPSWEIRQWTFMQWMQINDCGWRDNFERVLCRRCEI